MSKIRGEHQKLEMTLNYQNQGPTQREDSGQLLTKRQILLTLGAVGVGGCHMLAQYSFPERSEQPEPEQYDPIPQITDRQYQANLAAQEFSVDWKAVDAISDPEKRALVEELLVVAGSALLVEYAQQDYKATDTLLAKVFLKQEAFQRTKIQREVNDDCAKKLHALGDMLSQYGVQSVIGRFSLNSFKRELAPVQAKAHTLANKLEQFPNFSWKTDAMSAVGGLVSGAPTARDFNDMKSQLREAISAGLQ